MIYEDSCNFVVINKKGEIVKVFDDHNYWIFSWSLELFNKDIAYRYVIPRYSEKLFPFVKEGKYGYADQKGNVVIDPIFDFAYPLVNGYAIACIGQKSIFYPRAIYLVSSDGTYSCIDIKEKVTVLKDNRWGKRASDVNIVIKIPSFYGVIKQGECTEFGIFIENDLLQIGAFIGM